MTREEAIQEAKRFGKRVYTLESSMTKEEGETWHDYSIHVDGIFKISSEKSWEACIAALERMNPAEERKKKAAELRAELEELEGAA